MLGFFIAAKSFYSSVLGTNAVVITRFSVLLLTWAKNSFDCMMAPDSSESVITFYHIFVSSVVHVAVFRRGFYIGLTSLALWEIFHFIYDK